jgi:hypothetical protein
VSFGKPPHTLGHWLIIGVLHGVSALFILAILGPLAYDLQHGWGSAGDGYMLPFILIPLGGPVVALSLLADIKQIQTKSTWSWTLWPAVVVSGITLIAVMGFVVLLVGNLLFHKSAK